MLLLKFSPEFPLKKRKKNEPSGVSEDSCVGVTATLVGYGFAARSNFTAV